MKTGYRRHEEFVKILKTLIFMAIGKKKPKFNEFALGLAMLAAIFIAQAVRVM